MEKIMYCEKCGFVGYVLFRKKCKNCNTKLKILSERIKQKYNIFNDDWAEIGKKLNAFSNLTLIGTFNEELNLREELLLRTNKFVMNELSNNPLFSMEEFENQVQKQRQINYELTEYHQKKVNDRISENTARIQKESDKVNCIPKCPICGSSNIHKITVSTRAVKTAAFGLAGAVDDAGKTYKCGNCGSDF